jgi:hypothetical protein
VLIRYYMSINAHPASGDHQVRGIPTMPLLGTFYMAAIPANALNQCGRSHWGSGEKKKTVSDQRPPMN